VSGILKVGDAMGMIETCGRAWLDAYGMDMEVTNVVGTFAIGQ